MRVYILGGGPAGLALADGLSDTSDIPFTLIERDARLGGLAKTLQWDDFGSHDLGPHKIFSLDSQLMTRVENLLSPEDWLVQEKKSRIFLKGHYLPYPPSPFSLLKVYGAVEFALMIADFLKAKVRHVMAPKTPGNFAEDLEGRVGRKLFDRMFRPIAEKLWTDPRDLDLKLSKSRVQTPSIAEVILRMLKLKKTSEFEALTFKYPIGGLQKLWDSIQKKSSRQGEFLVNHEVQSIELDGNRINRLILRDTQTGAIRTIELHPDDFVFSTIPLKSVIEKMNTPFPASAQKALELIRLNDLILVFLKLKQDKLFADSWFFVPDADIPFHRVSEQRAFDPGMTPNGTIVCCELMSSSRRSLVDLKDDDLVSLAIGGLSKMGFTDAQPIATRVIRLKKSYPVFIKGFEEGLDSLLSHMDRFENFKTVGRQGSFNYIGTLDAMDIGYGAARWLLQQTEKSNSTFENKSWKEERQRTKLYPVLD